WRACCRFFFAYLTCCSRTSMAAATEAHKVIVYGGKGALGSACVQYFRAKHCWVASIDLCANEDASANVTVKMTDSFTEQANQESEIFLLWSVCVSTLDYCNCLYFAINKSLIARLQAVQNAAARSSTASSKNCHKTPVLSSLHWLTVEVSADVGELLGEEKVDAIFCVAGGWAGGSAKAKTLYKNAELMWKQSVWTSTICSHLATKHLRDGGLLTLAGAKAALGPTAGCIGYGMAKAAVHQLCQSLSKPNSGLPPGSTVVAILPETLDTPMNRKFMPGGDASSWTPLEYITELFYKWTTGENRPASGALVQLVTAEGKTVLCPV
ncbi:hypothetical protein DNTS_020377, partial [Danionella cerebrum]